MDIPLIRKFACGYAQGVNIEAALAHVDSNKVRAAYNRTDYLERRRKMMCWWSEHIEEASTGNYSVTGNQHLKIV